MALQNQQSEINFTEQANTFQDTPSLSFIAHATHQSNIYSYVWITLLFSCMATQYITALALAQAHGLTDNKYISFFLICIPQLVLYGLDRCYHIYLLCRLPAHLRQRHHPLPAFAEKSFPWLFWGSAFIGFLGALNRGYEVYQLFSWMIIWSMLYLAIALLFSHLAHFFINKPVSFERLSFGPAPKLTSPVGFKKSLSPAIRQLYLRHQQLFGHLYQSVIQLKIIIQVIVMGVLEIEQGYLTPGWMILYGTPEFIYGLVIILDLLNQWDYLQGWRCKKNCWIKIIYLLFAFCAGSLCLVVAPSTKKLKKAHTLSEAWLFKLSIAACIATLISLFSLGFKNWQRTDLDYQMMQLMKRKLAAIAPNDSVRSKKTTLSLEMEKKLPESYLV